MHVHECMYIYVCVCVCVHVCVCVCVCVCVQSSPLPNVCIQTNPSAWTTPLSRPLFLSTQLFTHFNIILQELLTKDHPYKYQSLRTCLFLAPCKPLPRQGSPLSWHKSVLEFWSDNSTWGSTLIPSAGFQCLSVEYKTTQQTDLSYYCL